MKELKQSPKFRKIMWRLIVSFVLLLSLFVVKQLVMHYQMIQEENTSHMINIAGRQRMLSQKITKELTFIQQGLADQPDELEASLAQFTASQAELVTASEEDKVTQRNNELIIHMYAEIESAYENVVQATQAYIEEWQQADSDPLLLDEYFNQVRQQETVFLDQMDEIVFTYEEEARQALVFIQNTNIFLFILILLLLFFVFMQVFLPLVNDSMESYLQMRNIRQDLLRILENMKGMLFLVNRAGAIVFTNDEAELLLQTDHMQVKGQQINEVVDWLNFDVVEFVQEVDLETEEDIEILAENAQGKIVALSLSAVTGYYNEEEVVLLALHDLTKQKDAEALLKKIAIRDELTGLYNRHVLENIIGKEFSRADQYDLPLSVTLLDIDNFKQINDQYGHPAGDGVLRLLAQTLLAKIRASDYVVRIGGEEILIFLPNTRQEAAVKVAEKLRKQLEKLDHPAIGQVTASFGVVERQPGEAYLDLYSRVDDALYHAKQNGKNQVQSI